jgi:hypothetical protein
MEWLPQGHERAAVQQTRGKKKINKRAHEILSAVPLEWLSQCHERAAIQAKSGKNSGTEKSSWQLMV